MSGFTGVQPDPSMIGRLVKPAFAILPDPVALFRNRAERFGVLATDSLLAPYLGFLARVASAQADLAAALPPVDPVPAEQVERARTNTMPPIDRAALAEAPALRAVIARFLDAAASIEMPAQAAAGLAALRAADDAALREMVGNVLVDAAAVEALPQHLFLSAALQVHAASLAATLDAERLVPVETGVCPCCGGPPVASRVVGWQGAENARYVACGFCGTQWNEVRVKCLACGSTKGIGYKGLEGEAVDGAAPAAEKSARELRESEPTVKAETCDECHSWVKVFYANRNPSIEAVADDVASLALDLLMRDTEYRRAGFDPFLIGY